MNVADMHDHAIHVWRHNCSPDSTRNVGRRKLIFEQFAPEERPIVNDTDQRPAVSVAHVVLQTDRMEESARFARTIGMRPIFDGPQVSVYEMRGGTHLILMFKDKVAAGDAALDLMVDDLRATHQKFMSLGLSPSPIEARPAIDHEVFTVREPAGHVITFFSNHASGKPI